MTDEKTFDFEAEPEESYDPLADFEEAALDEDVDDSEGQAGPMRSTNRMTYYDAAADERPASERIEELFKRLEPRKRVLAGILRFLDVPKRADALEQHVNELQEYDYSVYDGYSYSRLLHRAGAIDKVDEEGNPFPEDYEQQPDIVEVEGIKYYKPTDGVMVYWVATDAAREYLAKDDPEARMKELLNDQVVYAPIYRRILEACSSPDGASAKLLADLVDSDPLCQNPRRWSSFYSKRLEDCEALVWQGAWKTTDIGRKALDVLAEIIAAVAEKEGE
mgnify:CR=1 FL=1